MKYMKLTDEQKISIHALREEGDQEPARHIGFCGKISIHALREEGDTVRPSRLPNVAISIHALREEGDSLRFPPVLLLRDFYPRPPRGGRPWHRRTCWPKHEISIHALREEGDERSSSYRR